MTHRAEVSSSRRVMTHRAEVSSSRRVIQMQMLSPGDVLATIGILGCKIRCLDVYLVYKSR